MNERMANRRIRSMKEELKIKKEAKRALVRLRYLVLILVRPLT
jgi:hypothetical protein